MCCYLHRFCLVWLSMTLLVCGVGCDRGGGSAESTARAFLDRYFVELDQKAALGLTEGVARAKIEDEIRRLGDDRSSAAEERTRIYYRQVARSVQEDGVAFRFRLTVVVPGDATVEPELLVRVRSNEGTWRVSNFEVLPLPESTPEA